MATLTLHFYFGQVLMVCHIWLAPSDPAKCRLQGPQPLGPKQFLWLGRGGWGTPWDDPTARSMEHKEPDEQETSLQMLPALVNYTTTEEGVLPLARLLPASFTENNPLPVGGSPSGMFPLDLLSPV